MAATLPIATLTDLARSQATEAARKLAVLQDANLTAGQKLEVLLQYREDYDRQLQMLLAAGLGSAQWRNYQDFLKALDDGIALQRTAVAQAEDRLDRGRGDWQQQRQRQNAFETLAERMRRQEMLVANRHEQRASDEQAARMVLGRRSLPDAITP